PIGSMLVGESDIAGLNLVFPPRRQIAVRIVVEGDAPVPRFDMTLIDNSPRNPAALIPQTGSVSIQEPLIPAIARGSGMATSFTLALADGDYTINPSNLPGYRVKSILYGEVDVL